MPARHALALAATLVAIGVFGAAPQRARAVAVGQVDTFEDGTTDGWVVALNGASSPVPPINVATGGPAGDGDAYLLLRSIGGGGPGSKLTGINVSQWTGDFKAAGVTAISLDLDNLGDADLSLRLLFQAGAPATDLAVSTVPVLLAAGSGWTHVVFPITEADLTVGFGSAANALANATQVRLFHAPTASSSGPAIIASLGVDNIRAVPEPGDAMLIAVGFGSVAALRRRESRSAQPARVSSRTSDSSSSASSSRGSDGWPPSSSSVEARPERTATV